jgi:hypothetical protein
MGGCSCQDVKTWSASNRHKHRDGAAKRYLVGLDVSLEETSISIVDETGRIVKELRALSEPEALVAALQGTNLALERIGLMALVPIMPKSNRSIARDRRCHVGA